MKLLLLIFIFYISYSLSQQIEEDTSKKFVKSFPKKVRPGLILYNNAGKYLKQVTLKPNKLAENQNLKGFTTFPKPFPFVEQINQQIVPDSPYFPVGNPPDETRSRGKMSLAEFSVPEYPRVKRSAVDKKEADKKAPTKTSANEGVKQLKAPNKTSTSQGGVKKIKAPVSLGSKNIDGVKKAKARLDPLVSQAKKINAAEHQLHASRIGKKKRALSHANHNRTASQVRNKKQKRTHPENKSPASGLVSKKLKSTDSKKLSNPAVAGKRSKTARQKRVMKNLRNVKNSSQKKKLSSPQRNRTSKRTAVRSRKDLGARRLIAGRDALVEEYPYVVSLQKDQHHWCSGALLNPRLVITTANCLWRSKSISRMRVRVGSTYTDRGGQLTKIQEVMKHPGWRVRKNPDNDIALVLLDRNVKFSHVVHGVDLPNRVMMPPFDDAWITSWGSDRRDGIYDTRGMTLQAYHARLMERDKCNNLTQRFGVGVSENFICLAQSGRRAPCTRDTGAPAVSDGVLWGLASWGIRKLCGTERFPAMFSYLASQTNMDFIINATHYLMSDNRYYPFLDRYPVPKVTVTTAAALTLPF